MSTWPRPRPCRSRRSGIWPGGRIISCGCCRTSRIHAYQRANQLRPQVWPELNETRYSELYTYAAPDVSRTDNQVLSLATKQLAEAFAAINAQYPGSATLRKLLLKLLLKFSGEQQDDDILQRIMDEAGEANLPAPTPAQEEAQQERVKQNGYR